MSTHPPEQFPIVERVERAMVLLAYFIELDGDVHVPMFEKFEAELEELRKADDVKARARRLLALHDPSRGLKAVARWDVISKKDEDVSPQSASNEPFEDSGSRLLTADPAS